MKSTCKHRENDAVKKPASCRHSTRPDLLRFDFANIHGGAKVPFEGSGFGAAVLRGL
jgi:hypothetical protein